MRISFFSKKYDNLPKPKVLAWQELCKLLSVPDVRASKDGRLFSGASFTVETDRKIKNNVTRGIWRLNECVSEISLLLLDYDKAPDMQAALAAWQEFEHVAYTTYSHGTAKKPCAFRVVIPLATPIPAEKYLALWQWAFEKSGALIDESCKDESRMVYLPACPPDRSAFFQFIHHQSHFLDWRALDLKPITQPQITPPLNDEKKCATTTIGDRYTRNAVMGKYGDAIDRMRSAPDGGKHRALLREGELLGGLLHYGYFTENGAIEALVSAIADRCSDVKAAYKTAKNALNHGAQNPVAISKPEKSAASAPQNTRSAVQEKIVAQEQQSAPEQQNSDADAGNGEAPTKIPENFALNRGALQYIPNDEDKKPFRLCGHIEIAASTVDQRGSNAGRLLRFRDDRGKKKEMVMPKSLLVGDGTELCKLLSDRDFWISKPFESLHRKLIMQYINDSRPSQTFTTTQSTGWHGKTFVLTGGEVIGDGEKVIFTGADTDIYAASGSLEDWQNNVAALAVGNSRLEFGTSVSLTGVLMPLAGDSGGIAAPGINFFGNPEKESSSSTGKTTTLRVSASIWGSPAPGGFIFKWDATGSGLETRAVERNHTVFCIDELGGGNERRIGKDVYMFSSGETRIRAKPGVNGDVDGAKSKTWCAPFISTAEITLQAHMEKGGETIRAGQTVRCLDIPANAGAGFGVFENLHGFLEKHGGNAKAAGAAFADLLTENTLKYHGTAGRAFITGLLKMGIKEALVFVAEKRREFVASLPSDASGLVRRASKLFSLTAAAGELATHLGVLPWQPGAAMLAARRCFNDWLAENGGGNPEERAALSQVAFFLESGSFCNWHEEPEQGRKTDGYIKHEDQTVYFVKPETFKRHACKGFSPKFVIGLLDARGALLCGNDSSGIKQYSTRKPDMRRAYAIKISALDEALRQIQVFKEVL